jgi:hypothetical protein
LVALPFLVFPQSRKPPFSQICQNSPYFDGWKAFESNPFHPTDNPEGVIQMGLAENQVKMLISFF